MTDRWHADRGVLAQLVDEPVRADAVRAEFREPAPEPVPHIGVGPEHVKCVEDRIEHAVVRQDVGRLLKCVIFGDWDQHRRGAAVAGHGDVFAAGHSWAEIGEALGGSRQEQFNADIAEMLDDIAGRSRLPEEEAMQIARRSRRMERMNNAVV